MQGLPAESATGKKGDRSFRHGLVLLLAVVALAYLPALGGGFLNWDDPWLLESNSMLQHPSGRVLWQIWTDFSLPIRYAFGAEYLPLRDTSHLVEAWVTGIQPLPLRLVNLGLYLGAVVAVHRLMRQQLASEATALVATAIFALHPVHVESVAWLAGRKDLLALLFSALGMCAYATRRNHSVWVAAFWFLLAVLSKSMSVVLPLLLPLLDIWARRRPSFRAVGVCLLTVLLVLPLHVHVGQVVGMAQPRAGGSLSNALATMGPVWPRYAAVLLWPPNCSLVQEVPTLTHWTFTSVIGYATIGVGTLVAIRYWRRGKVQWLVALGFFLLPLLPVSQVIVPLQNRMADRYLWWSVLGLAVLLSWLVECWPRAGAAAALGVLVFSTVVTVERAALFGDSALVFADATRKTTQSGVAPYQLAMALEEQGDVDGARVAYEEVWNRTLGRDETSRRATNNLARLEVRQGNLDRAEWLLRRGLLHFPTDAKMQGNLDKVLAKREASRQE